MKRIPMGFAILLLVLLLPCAARAAAEEPAPWQLHGPADVKCDQSSAAAQQRFWEAADWGDVPAYRQRLVEYCGDVAGPSSPSMRCTPDLRFCQARHVRVDVSAEGKAVAVSTACALQETFPPKSRFFGGISDWTPELPALTGAADLRSCDVVVHEPTLLVKPDSRANIYHGLCDHINLFLSAWIAGWQDAADLQIVNWEPELHQERVPSGWYQLYDALTTRPVRPLGFWAGRSVCFDNAVFAVNPRTPDTFFYNMDVPGRAEGCRSGADSLVRAFAERTRARVLARPPHRPGPDDPVRVKVMSRSAGTGMTSGTRHVTNEAELIAALRRRVPGIDVEVVNFDWNGRPPIAGQLALMADTDVLVGMHGAGLVHALWLPEWAVLFEIYNCGDVNTYSDLARLAGAGYVTLPEAGVRRVTPLVTVAAENRANPKFWNYEVSEDAFVAQVAEAVRRVRANPASPFRKPPSELPGERKGNAP
ncbi:MAG TPA: glycosyltransferase family 61 protein [Thermoanaerobaculia bacterium]|nr:glycosyltransferase family 61 protein [Thermoanaerobaculia bacterium]